MPDWLTNVTATQVDPTLRVLATRLALAWLCGCVVAWMARQRRPAGTVDTLTLTLVLMSILIAMATQIIGDNIARAFSLVGALSIVRFRTAVPETRDVAFVLAAVVVGMAVGAGQYWVSGLGLIVVGLATHFNGFEIGPRSSTLDSSPAHSPVWRLALTVGLSATNGWQPELARFSDKCELVSAETTRRGGAIELAYRITLKREMNAVDLVAALNSVPTVELVAAKMV